MSEDRGVVLSLSNRSQSASSPVFTTSADWEPDVITLLSVGNEKYHCSSSGILSHVLLCIIAHIEPKRSKPVRHGHFIL